MWVGSLQQQLAVGDLTPLGRWFLELQLLEQEERDAHRQESVPTDATGAADDTGKQDPALSSLLAALAHDKLCFDIVYALGGRVQDVLGEIQDSGDEIAGTNEVLCFSSIVNGIACRVTCLRRGDAYSFRSSSYIPRLEEELRRYVTCQEDGNSAMIEVLRLIRAGLEGEQTQ